MKTNPSKCKAIRFTRAPAGSPLGYSLCNQEIPNASSFKDLRIVIRSDSNWVDHVNYITQTRWKAHHFVMCVLINVSTNTKSLAYMSLVRPVLEYVAACWDPCGEGKIKGLDRAQTKAARFTNHTKDFDWESLAQLRPTARLCALYKAYSGERAWIALRDGSRRSSYLSRVDHVRTIRDRKQETDTGSIAL